MNDILFRFGKFPPLAACFLAAGLLLGAAAPRGVSQGGPPSQPATLRVHIQGPIGWPQVALVSRALREVQAGEAAMVVLELDTPGGRLDATRQLVTMVQAIRKSRVQVVSFVNSQAYSGGAILALSTGRIYMTPSGVIGDAYPIQMDALGRPKEIPEGIRSKEISALRSMMRSLALSFPEGRRKAVSVLAEGMVDPTMEIRKVQVKDKQGVTTVRVLTREQEDLLVEQGYQVKPLALICDSRSLVTLTAPQALDLGVSDGTVEDFSGLLSLFNVDPSEVKELHPTATEKFVDFLESISFLLLMGGLLFGMVALKIPGFGVPEVLSLVCFFLLFLAHYYAGLAGWLEPLLFLGGVALILLELFVIPGTFVVGGIGVLMALAGLVLSFQSFIIPENGMQTLYLEENLQYFVAAVLLLIAGGFLIAKLLPGLPLFHKVILESPGGPGRFTGQAEARVLLESEAVKPGKRGKALSPLRPAGRAEFEGEILDVQTEGEFLGPGTELVILRVESNKVVVKRLEEERGRKS